MAKGKNTGYRKQTHYRDSKTGEFLSKKEFERKSPATVEKERIKHPVKRGSGKSKGK